MQTPEEMIARILELKEKKNAVILAHNYQISEIQDLADFTGDSLELSRQATRIDRPVIVFCGVDFMAESAAVLNPDKTVTPRPPSRPKAISAALRPTACAWSSP